VLPVVDAVAELPSLLGPVEDRGAGGEAVGGEEVAGLLVFGLIAAGGELKQEVTEGVRMNLAMLPSRATRSSCRFPVFGSGMEASVPLRMAAMARAGLVAHRR
jgi:hypothetical protein